jgi:hypothetical protein
MRRISYEGLREGVAWGVIVKYCLSSRNYGVYSEIANAIADRCPLTSESGEIGDVSVKSGSCQ